MSNSIFFNEPITINQPLTYNNFTIETIAVNINQSATVAILLKLDNAIVGKKDLIMSGDDYKAWGTDDSYVFNWVVQKLGSS